MIIGVRSFLTIRNFLVKSLKQNKKENEKTKEMEINESLHISAFEPYLPNMNAFIANILSTLDNYYGSFSQTQTKSLHGKK